MSPLGRTNREFPAIWLSLTVPTHPGEGWLEELTIAAQEADTVIDISSNPALWCGKMRGTDAILMTSGGADIARATDEKHAYDLVQAHLIETLCAIGREYIDFYFLTIKERLTEAQISGALGALEDARQEGHVRYVGLKAEAPASTVQSIWQFHDAFDVVLLSRSEEDDSLRELARQRRVGIIEAGEGQGSTRLVKVRNKEEIEAAGQLTSKSTRSV